MTMDTHRRHRIPLFFLALIHLLLHVSAHEFLLPGSSLSVERSTDVLLSPDGTFTCGFYNSSSNATVFSIWFSNSAEKTVVWSANHLHPVYTWGSRVELDIHGNMVVKDYNGQIAWTNNMSSSDADRAQLQDTGNLVIKGKGNTILWQSFSSPTDTLLPNQNITAATKLVSAQRLLVPGRYSFGFDDENLLSLFDYENGIYFIYWPNPQMTIWGKQRVSFSSTTIGALDSSGHFQGSDSASFTAADWGPGIKRRLTLDYDGNLRLYSLNEDGTWSVTWMGLPGSAYIKLPEDVRVLEPSIPQSQPFGPEYGGSKCDKVSTNVTTDFLDLTDRSHSGPKYWYTYKELQKATRKFTDELGRGASVRIWGFCSNGPQRILISEFMENGSLDKTLFGRQGLPILLEWKQRFNIALGVAKGLAYLHHECLEWVIHCDVKPENILLDENMEPKITDFGLAKLLNRAGSNRSISRIRGTRGYIAPEWVSSLPITAKVDVYSFGVVLLELLKGARVSEWAANADEAVEMGIRRNVRMLEENTKMQDSEEAWIPSFIDPRLNSRFNGVQARTMIKLAVSCVQEDRNIRPTMENVVQKLLSVDEASSIKHHYSLN
ncbi:hypothetical protein U9M48_027081 [Paspalum notatum var. saurae]|uniref:non-specific serine/threonine protein kinase n=1 Tax=Paspalum notatum var. saurae TaxID=547442 RepID=A0AAQ3WZM1_PASNO